jgi:hypothetical protein
MKLKGCRNAVKLRQDETRTQATEREQVLRDIRHCTETRDGDLDHSSNGRVILLRDLNAGMVEAADQNGNSGNLCAAIADATASGGGKLSRAEGVREEARLNDADALDCADLSDGSQLRFGSDHVFLDGRARRSPQLRAWLRGLSRASQRRFRQWEQQNPQPGRPQ